MSDRKFSPSPNPIAFMYTETTDIQEAAMTNHTAPVGLLHRWIKIKIKMLNIIQVDSGASGKKTSRQPVESWRYEMSCSHLFVWDYSPANLHTYKTPPVVPLATNVCTSSPMATELTLLDLRKSLQVTPLARSHRSLRVSCTCVLPRLASAVDEECCHLLRVSTFILNLMLGQTQLINLIRKLFHSH